MLDEFELGGHALPVVLRVEEWDEVGEVEVADHHVVDAFGLDAAVGAGEAYLADFLQHLLVFLVEDVFVHEEGDECVAERVPHALGEWPCDEASEHEAAGGEA